MRECKSAKQTRNLDCIITFLLTIQLSMVPGGQTSFALKKLMSMHLSLVCLYHSQFMFYYCSVISHTDLSLKFEQLSFPSAY